MSLPAAAALGVGTYKRHDGTQVDNLNASVGNRKILSRNLDESGYGGDAREAR